MKIKCSANLLSPGGRFLQQFTQSHLFFFLKKRRTCLTLAALLSLLTASNLSSAFPPGEFKKAGYFLVASENITDPRFREAVLLITGHGNAGSAGVIINKPMEVTLSSVFPNSPGLKNSTEKLYMGGPVNHQSLVFIVRSQKTPPNSLPVINDVYITFDPNNITQQLHGNDPLKNIRVFAGFAGWQPGQLESEIARGDWRKVDANINTVFQSDMSSVWSSLKKKASGKLIEI